MANELQAFAATGATLYALLLDGVGRAWNGTTFVTIAGGSWPTYDISMTEAAGGIYLASMPSVAAGTYLFVIYQQAGAAPAITDTQRDTGEIAWNGSAVAAPAGTGYASTTQMRAYLSQVPAGVAVDALLQECLDRASAAIDNELGFSFGGYASTATARAFSSRGGMLLHMPFYESGSLTALALTYADSGRPETPVQSAISLPAAITFSDYQAEADNHTYLWRPTGWPAGRYSAEAKWGYGSAPASIVQVVLELAINLWLAKDGGQFSDVVGIEGGGAVGYNRAWTNRQRMILAATRLNYGDVGFA